MTFLLIHARVCVYPVRGDLHTVGGAAAAGHAVPGVAALQQETTLTAVLELAAHLVGVSHRVQLGPAQPVNYTGV
jgi:hypothetical protein